MIPISRAVCSSNRRSARQWSSPCTKSWPGLRPQPNGSSHEDKVAEFAKIQPAHRRRRLNFRKFSYAGPFSLPPHEKPCQENKTLRVCSAEAFVSQQAMSERSRRQIACRWLLCLTVFLETACLGPRAAARDHFLVIGGGPTASLSQVSMENNVRLFVRALTSTGVDAHEITLLFGSGGDGQLPDVAFRAEGQVPVINSLLADILGPGTDLRVQYRHHDLPGDVAPATRRVLFQELAHLAQRLRKGDRLVLYVTGHGVKGENERNAQLLTWSQERISVRELTGALDGLVPEVQVLVVMAQCYAGSFANLIFAGGDPSNGLAAHQRAGFFATISTLPAAGCSSEVREHDDHDYSGCFWSAVAGGNGPATPVRARDVDEDGRISLTEAHAFAVIWAPTIDVPLKTSDVFLREHSRVDRRNGRHLLPDGDYSRLRGAAEAAGRLVLDKLSTRLGLTGEDRISKACQLANSVEAERRRRQQEIQSLQTRAERLRRRLARALTDRWPVLKSPWHPQTQLLLASHAQQVVCFLQQQAEYEEWSQTRQQLKQLEKQDLADRKRWAVLQRLTHTAESVALAHNLRLDGQAGLVRHYEEMLALENTVLVPGNRFPTSRTESDK